MVREIYKIMAKILLNILKHVIQDVISDNQKTFIAGRHIVDGFMIANKVAHDLHKWRKDMYDLLKLISTKPFDIILWEYLDEITCYMGFGNKWRRLIHECLSSSQLSS
jgi:hypothetical protein